MWSTALSKFQFPYDEFDTFFSNVNSQKLTKSKFSYSSEVKENSCLLKVEVPGIDPKNISVSFSGQQVTVTSSFDDKKETWKIDKQYDVEKCVASYSFGVLTMKFPKKIPTGTETGTIEVSIA